MNVVFEPLVPQMWAEVEANVGAIAMADTRGVVAIDSDTGRILAAGIADTFSHSSCQVHMWIRSPMVLRHGFLEEIFNYIFNT